MIKLNDYKQMYSSYPGHTIAMSRSGNKCFVCELGAHPYIYSVNDSYLCNTCKTYLSFMNENKDGDKEIFTAYRLDSNRDLALLKMKLLNNISITNKKGATKNAFNMIADLVNEIPLHYKVLNVASLCIYTATTHGTLNRSVVSNVFKYAEYAELITKEELDIYEQRVIAL